ncbi:MAG: PAS domain S-box protein [Paenibacillus sp.]|uniref:histidine kinase n=1 Tax=Paenibacillus aquistagni TaxID=1852522 RepID=A0A1X7LXJ4_9BACL|nr:ATP-binding protein [Paenibacillus aquistagni]MBR2568683.1 PAS domain S-box protein [Paenibacillus sp.]NMM55133.1 PAS domain S-box protein [Paenibacillus aquistagni]SMG58575.1 two-component system, sporulation sensor kinase E [Paenibacillus aquistagni]
MKLSIKGKLSLSISIIMFVVLLTHMIFNYYSMRTRLMSEMEERAKIISEQVSISMIQAQRAEQAIGDLLAEQLYAASVYAAEKLPPKLSDITPYDLYKITGELNISDLSLLQRTTDGQDIVIRQSTEPREIGLSTKEWGYWYTAFEQLLSYNRVWVPIGQKMKNFWSGPIEMSTSIPSHRMKWGYYYDGKRDYIINPYIKDSKFKNSFQMTNPERIIERILHSQANVLEITAYQPDRFNDESMATANESEFQLIEVPDRPILYGTYRYRHDQDSEMVGKAAYEGIPIFKEFKFNDEQIIKSYMPLREGNNHYVLGIVLNAEPLQAALKEQLLNNIGIGFILLEIVIIGSYIFSGWIIRPIQYILQKVSMMAIGQFNTNLTITRNDELGLLARRINMLGVNLHESTERLRTLYEENRAMKYQLESFINQSSDAIHVTDLDGKVERVNESFVQLFGWTEHELIGKPLPIYPEAPSEDGEGTSYDREEALVGVKETVRVTKDGRRIEVSVSRSPIYNESGQCIGWAGITRDITQRNRMEELLRRSEKLTTVGQLAAGVAHEIRNPLTTIKGFVQLQAHTLKVNPKHTTMMLSELDRINLIVSEFLILAKPQAVRFLEKDIRPILDEVVSLLNSEAHLHNVQVTTAYGAVPMILCEENQMKQVFINLIKNGIEAMPSGGSLQIKVNAVNEDGVSITVKDQGIGIPQENLPKLGDPFFTNKENGTGLGLMVCHRIIDSHHGNLFISSEVNVGTEVKIVLPAAHVSKEKIEQEKGYISIR